MDKIELGDLLIQAHDLIRELDQSMRGLAPDYRGLTQEDLTLLKTLKSKGDELIKGD